MPNIASPLVGIRSPLGEALGFRPSSLLSASNLVIWYDPSDFTTMFKDVAGTDPVTAAGDPVALIRDKLGLGFNASQATSTARPVLQQDGTGRWFLLFDGVDDSLVTSSINFSATNKVTAVSGVRKLSDAADGGFLAFGNPNAAENGSFLFGAPGSNMAAKFQFASRGSSNAIPFTTSAVYNAPFTGVVTGIADISAPSATLRINQTQVSQLLTSQGTGQYGTYALRLGRRDATTWPFNGRVYSVIVCGNVLTSSQLTQAENFVNNATGAY